MVTISENPLIQIKYNPENKHIEWFFGGIFGYSVKSLTIKN